MSSFAPVYKPPSTRQSYYIREPKRVAHVLRKRKREAAKHGEELHESSSEESRAPKHEAEAEAEIAPSPRAWHPVNKTDPYNVAGVSRDDQLSDDDSPFALSRESKKPIPQVEEELSQLNPPLLVPKVTSPNESGSLKRRHLDNLTAILHKCMLKGDWTRANRVCGLILRTELQGYGVDVRHNGRWAIGAELLMRRCQDTERTQGLSRRRHSDDNGHDLPAAEADSTHSNIPDQGFRMAREYYDRLILQYPNRPQSRRDAITAVAIYPALYNVWIYEIQNRAKRACQMLTQREDALGADQDSASERSENSNTSKYENGVRHVRIAEVDQAMEVARHMDELMLNPPFDASPELMYLRSMIFLWVCSVNRDISTALARELSTALPVEDEAKRTLQRQHDNTAKTQREELVKLTERMSAARIDIPPSVRAFLEDVDVDATAADEEESG